MRNYQVTLYGQRDSAGAVVRRTKVSAFSYGAAIKASGFKGPAPVGVKAL